MFLQVGRYHRWAREEIAILAKPDKRMVLVLVFNIGFLIFG